MLTHIDLFSGIGGFSLAAEWAGFTTVAFCECDPYCQAVLKKHWPEVPIVERIQDFKWPMADTARRGKESWTARGTFDKCGKTSDVAYSTRGQSRESKTWNGWKNTCRRSEEITLITGGFPCQPFSVAGKRRGKEDDRFLWPEMFRVIKEVRPRWVLGENVAGIVRMALDDCLADLEGEGYSTQAFIIPACAVNSCPHRRDRVWIVANSIGTTVRGERERTPFRTQNKGRRTAEEGRAVVCPRKEISLTDDPRQASQDVAYCDSTGFKNRPEEHRGKQAQGREGKCGIGRCYSREKWAVEPDVGRVAYGVPSRVDRLKCLGNAIVPAVSFSIIEKIAKIERGIK